MKKLLFILSLAFLPTLGLWAQDDDGDDKIRDKMSEFIQKRMGLTKAEAAKFSPVFIRYFQEWRKTMRDNKANPDPLARQQKMLDLRIRYRNEFKEIIGERRSNEVYRQQEIFIEELRTIRKDRMKDRRPIRGNNLRSVIQ